MSLQKSLTRACKQCQKEFVYDEVVTPHKQFCCGRCRNEWHNAQRAAAVKDWRARAAREEDPKKEHNNG